MAFSKRKRSDSGAKKEVAKPAPAAAVPAKRSVLQTEESAFPRGGGSVLTPLEVKQAANDATKDVLFGLSNKEESGPKTKKRKSSSKKKKSSSASTTTEEENTTQIESLSNRRLIPGTVILGQVAKINSLDMILSLPNSLIGFVPITNISKKFSEALNDSDEEDSDEEEGDGIPKIADYFKVGQWLRAIIVSTVTDEGKKKIELSIDPTQVNESIASADIVPGMAVQGSISSVEDHGILIDIANSKISGFISKKDLEHSKFDVSSAKPGQVLLLTVLSKSSNGRTVTLTASPLSKKVQNLEKLSSVNSATAGVMVEGTITEVRGSGLVVKIYDHLVGTIDRLHAGHLDSSKELGEFYGEGDLIRARITSTLPHLDENRVALSVLPHVLSLTAAGTKEASEALPVGFILENAKVVSYNLKTGLFFNVGVDGAFGFAHLTRISDDETPILTGEGKYRVESSHRARVLGYSFVDNLYSLSLEKSILDKTYLRVQDIPLGDIIDVTVSKILPTGDLIVAINDDLKGFVPALQITDIKLANPEKKFKIGTKSRAKVMAVDTELNRIKLSLKKSVLAHKGYVISSYEEATVGKKSPATIVSLKPNGARVEFFNNVYAFLPKLEMSEAFVKDPKDIFRLGQSINVRVISSQPDEQRMLVSARGDSESSAELQEQFDTLEAGRSIVSALAIEKTKDSIIFDIEPSKVRGILHVGHISDDDKEDVKKSLHKKLEVNKVIDELLVLQKDERKNTVFLTLKKSLIDAAKAEEFPRSIDDIHPSQVLHGFVSNVTATGVFVTFANRVTGLAYKSELFKNTVVEDPTKFFKKFQSVTCVVTNVDVDAERFTVSLKEFGNQQVNKKVLNPVDSSIKALSDFKVGRVINGRIKKIADTHLNIDLADNQAGRLDISQIYDTWADIKDPKNPLSVFKAGQTIKVKITGYYHSHHQKQVAKNDGVSSVFELSAKPSDLESKKTEQPTFENIAVGSKWVAYVRNISNDSVYLTVAADVAGRISLIELSEQLRTPHEHEELYPLGSAIQVTVVSKSTTNNGKLLDLTTRDDTTKVITSIEDLTEGQVLTGQIGKKLPMGIAVRLGNNVSAVVHPTDIADEFTSFDEITSTYTEGTFTKIKIVTVDKHNDRVFGSLRKSVIEGDVAEEEIADKVVNEVSDVHSGDLIRGYVSNIANSGLFVSLGRNVSGRVMIKDVTDGFVQDWKSLFKLHQLVKVRVLAVKGNRIELSLKKSAVGGKGVAGAGSFKDFNELEVGDIVTGHIKKIEEYGVFVTFDNTNNVDGLCHKSQISDTQIKDFSKLFSLGDRVKAKILAIDTEKRRISIGLKASYFDDEDEEMEDASEEEEEDEEMADASDSDSDNGFSRFSDSDDEEDEEHDGSDSSDEEPEPASFAGLASGTGLSAGFDWNTSILDNDAAAASDADSDEESSDSDSDADTRKKNKKNKRKAKKLIVEDKTAELGTKAPESVGDFERLLVGSPNSSVIWMSFMAFQLQLSEIDKAREIAERALKTISFREEDEKLNIWVAYLNLENSFGTEDSLEEVFKRATQYMDSRTVYEKMGKIYTMSGKIDKACNVYDAMCKKFNGETTSVWETYGQMLYEQASAATASGNKADADRYLNKARSVLDRALRLMKNSNLHSKKTEAELISKFARFEYAHGDQERGRTLFEGLVSSYPRRVDLWNVYIDQEIKHSSDRGLVEALFERVVGAGSAAGKGIGMKQAKFFFKKWLAYEDVHGDSKAVDYVKAKAAEYVSNRTASEE